MDYGKGIHGSQQSYALYLHGNEHCASPDSYQWPLGGLQAEGVSNFP